ncbi:hypothetical protein GCM10007391_01370 [Alteromonas halophila]|uniref:Uncharacterized protein n=1 Tax=Alteromonas halophila TaxID=516698 RepID=A0A918JCG2_9ALTE|nr:hypothetical protein GCM10007391_01370 [Alteromonas halophila]
MHNAYYMLTAGELSQTSYLSLPPGFNPVSQHFSYLSQISVTPIEDANQSVAAPFLKVLPIISTLYGLKHYLSFSAGRQGALHRTQVRLHAG